MSDVDSQEEASDEHPIPAPAQEPAHKRKRSDSITSISDGEFSEQETAQNFGARAPVHPSQLGDILGESAVDVKTFRSMKKAAARRALDAARLKILEALEKK